MGNSVNYVPSTDVSRLIGDSTQDDIHNVISPISRTAVPEHSDNVFSHNNNVDYKHRTEVDLDLMVYSIGKKNQKRTLLFDLLLYVPFIIFATLYIFFAQHINTSYWTIIGMKDNDIDEELPVNMSKIYKSYNDINTPAEYYQWLEGVFLNSQQFGDDYWSGLDKPANWVSYVQQSNKLIGALRMRQLRVKKNACTALPIYTPSLADFDTECYGAMGGAFPWNLFRSSEDETKASFPSEENPIWKYQSCSQLGGGSTYAAKFLTMPCGGYVEIFPYSWNKTQAEERVAFLKANDWYDKYTRGLMHEYFTYNANTNYITSVKLVVEWTNGGMAIPTWEYKGFRINHFREAKDWVYFAFCLFVPIYMVYFVFRYFLDFLVLVRYTPNKWLSHFINFWNLLEVIILLLILTSFVVRLIIYAHPANKLDVTMTTYPAVLEEMLTLNKVDNAVVAIFGILAWLKSFRFFSINDRLNILAVTVKNAALELILVGITLIIVLTAFAFSGYVIFGYDMYEYRDISSAYSTLLKMLLGNPPDYIELRDENRTLFPYHHNLFIVVGFLVVMNMFMAVLNDQFGEASNQVFDDDFGYDPKAMAIKAYKNLRRLMLRGKDAPQDDRSTVANSTQPFDQGDDDIIARLKAFQEAQDVNELTVQHLEASLGSEAPPSLVRRIMGRFDIDGDGTISLTELEKRRKRNAKGPQLKDAIKTVMAVNRIAQAVEEQRNKEDNVPLEEKLESLRKKLDAAMQQAKKIQAKKQQKTQSQQNLLQTEAILE